MMDKCDTIYGINPEEEINPHMVRNAILQCFFEADKEVIKKLFQKSDFESNEDKEIGKKHVEIVIKKMFEDVNGDFNNPTKESLINVVNKCKEFAGLFRDKETIEKHAYEIMTLINRLD
ncbi:hypothetical protein ACFL1L_01870 [Thermoplasmatota archaeon]